jgi:hypothetical protein
MWAKKGKKVQMTSYKRQVQANLTSAESRLYGEESF